MKLQYILSYKQVTDNRLGEGKIEKS